MKTLADYGLLICTPSGKAAPDSLFLESLIKTREYFKKHDGNIMFQPLDGCSEICGARNCLFTIFYNNPHHSHMLFIDDDTGWNPEDVARMLLLDREFLGAAAPKKELPIKFAFSAMNELSQEQEIEVERATRVASIKEVGTAFLMISRKCATKMVNAYPELRYGEKQDMYALFDPLIAGTRRYADDYSFCYRWRKLGERVQILLDVELSHAGRSVFKGSLWDALKMEPECAELMEAS
jgi:hypothetical protein